MLRSTKHLLHFGRYKMSNEEFNMSIRKFLKQVGVTSQQQIEEAVRIATEKGTVSSSLPIRMTLTIDKIGMEHVIEGEILTGIKS